MEGVGVNLKRSNVFPKEITRWFKALEIASVLFEEEGYHVQYLNQIEEFIRVNYLKNGGAR